MAAQISDTPNPGDTRMDTETPPASTASPDSEVYRTLLESTRAIPWQIDWKHLRFTSRGHDHILLGWAMWRRLA